MIRAFADATSKGHVIDVEKLLNADPLLITSQTPEGWTPLLLAAYYGQSEVAVVLLKRGAAPNEQDRDYGRTALHWAAEKGYCQLVISLLAHGGDANKRDKEGWTPLMRAAAWGRTVVVVLLLSYGGADPRLADLEGNTAEDHATSIAACAVLRTARSTCWRSRPGSSDEVGDSKDTAIGCYRSPSLASTSSMSSGLEEVLVLARERDEEVDMGLGATMRYSSTSSSAVYECRFPSQQRVRKSSGGHAAMDQKLSSSPVADDGTTAGGDVYVAMQANPVHENPFKVVMV